MRRNILSWMSPLKRQGCVKAVVIAMRKYDRSKSVNRDNVGFVSHEDAKAALRIAARKTGRRKFRTALDILEAEPPD